MSVYDKTISKICQLPEPLVQEVNDFIDFLLMKSDSTHAEALELAESDFSDYLLNLEEYEERLARGEIKW